MNNMAFYTGSSCQATCNQQGSEFVVCTRRSDGLPAGDAVRPEPAPRAGLPDLRELRRARSRFERHRGPDPLRRGFSFPLSSSRASPSLSRAPHGTRRASSPSFHASAPSHPRRRHRPVRGRARRARRARRGRPRARRARRARDPRRRARRGRRRGAALRRALRAARRAAARRRASYDGAAALARLAAAVRDGARARGRAHRALPRAAARGGDCARLFRYEDDGIGLGMRVRPLARVGVYAPGGKARYPSSVLMAAIPARVAGVNEIVARHRRTPDDRLLAAAHLAGVDAIVDAGGAQAIARARLRHRDRPRASTRSSGPGNPYVACAKRLVFGDVDIDGIAGPSEILVVADDEADPALVAADLLSQAEHDEAAYAVLVSTSARSPQAVAAASSSAARDAASSARHRRRVAARTRRRLVVPSRERCSRSPTGSRPSTSPSTWPIRRALLERIRHAARALLGRATPVALGDYLAGPSHVLPTGGCRALRLPARRLRLRGAHLRHPLLAPTRCAGTDAPSCALARAEGLEAPRPRRRDPARPGRRSRRARSGGRRTPARGVRTLLEEAPAFRVLAKDLMLQGVASRTSGFCRVTLTHGVRSTNELRDELSVGSLKEESPMGRMWTRALLLGAMGLAAGAWWAARKSARPSTTCRRTRWRSPSSSAPNLERSSATIPSSTCGDGRRRRLRRGAGRPVHVHVRAAALPHQVGDHRGLPHRPPLLRAHRGLGRQGQHDRRRSSRRRPRTARSSPSYKITSHFDIRRAYNPHDRRGAERHRREHDRPALVRARVLPRRLVAEPRDRLVRLRHAHRASAGSAASSTSRSPYTVLDPTDPDAPHFDADNGYFDVTNKAFAKPALIDLSSLGWGINTIPACMLPGEFAGGSQPYGNCNPVEITLR